MNLVWYKENGISINDSVGIDEVGRGPLAGPVVAAAVWISTNAAIELSRSNLVVRDSKKTTANQRKKVVEWIKSQQSESLQFSIASVAAEKIDEINILRATLQAMEKSHKLLNTSFKNVLVDGNQIPAIRNANVQAIAKGDSKVLSIALASIIAKEYRDNLMRELSLEYPFYGWETNVGYGTRKHLEAIFEHDITLYHRKTFISDKHHKKTLLLRF